MLGGKQQFDKAKCISYLINKKIKSIILFLTLSQVVFGHKDGKCIDLSPAMKLINIFRASLSTFGALDKFNLSGPQKLFIQKLAILPIIGQFTCISYICMHACTISTLFVKGMVSYCYCVHAAVSAGYPIT